MYAKLVPRLTLIRMESVHFWQDYKKYYNDIVLERNRFAMK